MEPDPSPSPDVSGQLLSATLGPSPLSYSKQAQGLKEADVHSLTHPFINSFTHPFINSLTPSFTHAPFINSLTQFINSLAHSLIHSPIH